MTTTSVQATGQVSNDQLQGKTASGGLSALTPSDFINLMVTELQNQDPTKPTDSSQLLSQMSQIGQLQSSTSLQTTLAGLAQQNQIGAASSLMGKSVEGLDANNSPVSGLVSSISVSTSGVTLGLDSGSSLSLASVTNIAPAPVPATTASSTN